MEEAAKKVWNNCLEFIKDNIDEQPFNTWFAPIEPIALDGNKLKIKVIKRNKKTFRAFQEVEENKG